MAARKITKVTGFQSFNNGRTQGYNFELDADKARTWAGNVLANLSQSDTNFVQVALHYEDGSKTQHQFHTANMKWVKKDVPAPTESEVPATPDLSNIPF